MKYTNRIFKLHYYICSLAYRIPVSLPHEMASSGPGVLVLDQGKELGFKELRASYGCFTY